MLILTSDLPSTPNPAVFELLRVRGDHTRIDWMAPITAAAVQHFPKARAAFAAQGLVELQPVDIDEQPDPGVMAELASFDATLESCRAGVPGNCALLFRAGAARYRGIARRIGSGARG